MQAIGRSFEETLQKAVRMVDPSLNGFEPKPVGDILEALSVPTENRLYSVAEAFRQGFTVDQIYNLTHIDRWFLHKCKHIHDTGLELEQCK